MVRLEGEGTLVANLDHADHGLADPRAGDYAIVAASPAVDAGVDPATIGLEAPVLEYVHPVSVRQRRLVWNFDVGAYERCGF